MSQKWAPIRDLPLLNIQTADGLTVNGAIVPTTMYVSVPLFVTDVSKTIFIASEAVQLVSVRCVYNIVSISGTLDIEKLTGTTAPGSGTSILQSTLDLTTSANTVLSGSLTSTTANLQLAAGNRLSVKLGGTLTGLVGATVTLGFRRI